MGGNFNDASLLFEPRTNYDRCDVTEADCGCAHLSHAGGDTRCLPRFPCITRPLWCSNNKVTDSPTPCSHLTLLVASHILRTYSLALLLSLLTVSRPAHVLGVPGLKGDRNSTLHLTWIRLFAELSYAVLFVPFFRLSSNPLTGQKTLQSE